MEAIETNYKSIQTNESTSIPEPTGTEINLRMLKSAVRSLHCRKDVLRHELKKPGIVADNGRLRELLTELEKISRALRGLNAGGLQ